MVKILSKGNICTAKINIINMIKRIKWFMGDVYCSINYLLKKRKISKLKMDDIVLFKNKKEFMFQGINYWGLEYGFLPQYSIRLIGKDGDCFSYFETSIMNVKLL